jgi:hypothetical protein
MEEHKYPEDYGRPELAEEDPVTIKAVKELSKKKKVLILSIVAGLLLLGEAIQGIFWLNREFITIQDRLDVINTKLSSLDADMVSLDETVTSISKSIIYREEEARNSWVSCGNSVLKESKDAQTLLNGIDICWRLTR